MFNIKATKWRIKICGIEKKSQKKRKSFFLTSNCQNKFGQNPFDSYKYTNNYFIINIWRVYYENEYFSSCFIGIYINII